MAPKIDAAEVNNVVAKVFSVVLTGYKLFKFS